VYTIPQIAAGDQSSLSQRAAKIDRVMDRLQKETIRLATLRAGISLIPLESSEVETSLESRKVDYVMDLYVSVEVAGSTGANRPSYDSKDAVLLVLLRVYGEGINYTGYFGCARGNPEEVKWTYNDTLWAMMEGCSDTLARAIIEEVFSN
jgi:hypothetical protein